MNTDIQVDNWPDFEVSPAQYEAIVADLMRSADVDVADLDVSLLDKVEGLDGEYIIDVTVRFRLFGLDYLTLFECKRHAGRVKREHVQVLHSKLSSTGAQKGVMVAASGFQRGALEYARVHGIGCVRLVDGAWTYEVRDSLLSSDFEPSGEFVAYADRLLAGGQKDQALLVGERDRVRELILPASGGVR
jgi:restriction system protein